MTDYETILIFAIAAIAFTCIVLSKLYRHEYVVPEGYVALFYSNGALAEAIPVGRHVRWGRHCSIAHVDIRKTLFQVAGQEVLTADNVSVKVSAALTTQVVDAVKTAREASNYTAHIYSAVQTALRDAVAAVSMDELLGQRATISTQLLEALAPAAEATGVIIHGIEVRDIMLPGELRKAFADVLKAKQEGLAALQRARGESAALRNLLNAARLVENQPALATLRFLQTLGGANAGQTIVMNDLSAFAPMARITKKQNASRPQEGLQ